MAQARREWRARTTGRRDASTIQAQLTDRRGRAPAGWRRSGASSEERPPRDLRDRRALRSGENLRHGARRSREDRALCRSCRSRRAAANVRASSFTDSRTAVASAIRVNHGSCTTTVTGWRAARELMPDRCLRDPVNTGVGALTTRIRYATLCRCWSALVAGDL